MTSPRQDYLSTGKWPEILFARILQWHELSPDWFTLSVAEMDWKKAIKRRKYQPTARPDLVDAARSALEQGFNVQEAKARGVQLRSR